MTYTEIEFRKGWEMTQWKRIHLPMQETGVPSLGQEDPLEKEMATQSSILAWRIPWTEKPGGIQSVGSQRIGRDLPTKLFPFNSVS